MLSDHPRPCVDGESRAQHAEIRHNAQRARFGYFWHIAVPTHSQLGAAGGPLSVQSQVTRLMLLRPLMMQRLNALSIDELQASTLVDDETVAVMTRSSCWASRVAVCWRCAVAGACDVISSVQRQVAVPSALKAAIVRLLAGAGALKHFRCPRHGRRRLWITEFGHPFAPRRCSGRDAIFIAPPAVG